MKVIFFAVAVCMFCIVFGNLVFGNLAYAGYGDRDCSVSVNAVNGLLPVTYNANARSNPDGTVYPGDAIHFLFRFSGSETCTSFSVEPLVGSENLSFRSALIVSDNNSNPQPHGIVLYKWIPKYLTTFHYYAIIDVDTKCKVFAGGTRSCATNYKLSESSVFSYREDQKLSDSDGKKISHYEKNNDKYYKTQTQSWHLVNNKTSYNIGIDKHVLEDKNSVDEFVSVVKSNCSNLSKHQGCVFGHIEVNTDIDDRKQICLFEELDSMGIKYDKSAETDQCIQKDAENKTSESVRGTGINCDSDGKCKSYTVTNDASIAPYILSPYGEIFFKYLQLPDPDGFPSKNNDGTYYLENAIGIHGIPDAPFKEMRNGIISFDGAITFNPLQMMDFATCDKMCNYALSGKKMSPSTQIIENGDMLSAHFSPDILGISSIGHVTKMYNINRYIGEYAGTADPLIVVYKPQIIHTSTWSRLDDAGYQSFDNRYAIAINYTGSLGGGPDDGNNSEIHPNRPVKITDVLGAFFMADSFGKISSDWRPDASVSDAHGLSDLTVHESIYKYIPENYSFVDSFPNPAMVYWNGTVADVFIDSAGFARMLRDVDVSEEKLETYNVNVTSYDTLLSKGYGGVPVDYLASTKYDFPWGYFSTPLNVTAFMISENMTPLQDKDVTIEYIESFDAENNSEFVSAVEFYLNKHNSSEFAYMHMADMYDLNPKISFDNSNTVLILLNKTGIHYDMTAYNKALKDNLLGKYFEPLKPEEITNMSPREFFIEPSYYDVEISASRDGITKTNVVSMGGAELSNIIKYKINMNQDNPLLVTKIDDTAMVAPNSYFGPIDELFVNGEKYSDTTCSNGCLVFLPDDSSVDVSITNIWSGVATAKNVTGPEIYKYKPESWIEDTPMRVFWIVFGLGVLYGSYRGIRMLYESRK